MVGRKENKELKTVGEQIARGIGQVSINLTAVSTLQRATRAERFDSKGREGRAGGALGHGHGSTLTRMASQCAISSPRIGVRAEKAHSRTPRGKSGVGPGYRLGGSRVVVY